MLAGYGLPGTNSPMAGMLEPISRTSTAVSKTISDGNESSINEEGKEESKSSNSSKTPKIKQKKKNRNMMTESERLADLLADTSSDEEIIEKQTQISLLETNPMMLVNPLEIPKLGVSLRVLRKYGEYLAWHHHISSTRQPKRTPLKTSDIIRSFILKRTEACTLIFQI